MTREHRIVDIERRAAEIAIDAETRAVRKHTTTAELLGWSIWVGYANRQPRTHGEWAGYLAAAIFNHPIDPIENGRG